MNVTQLSDEELVSRLSSLCMEGRRLLARLLVHLSEVETRKLHLNASYSSMFDFCTRGLGMSGGEAARRISAARLSRRFPWVLERVERGEIHLTVLRIVAPHQDDADFEDLVAQACGKSKLEVLELIARRHPRPDVPSVIVPLPDPLAPRTPLLPVVDPTVPKVQIEPLSEARYAMQMTITGSFKEKLARAKSLMSHRNSSGDPSVVLEAALDALLRELERDVQGKTNRPQKIPRPSKPGHIPRSVVREVWARDGAQCTWTDADGRRCPSKDFLQLDHAVARALAGTDEASNVRLLCAPHNLLHAEQDFGKARVERAIRWRQRQCGTPAAPPLEPSHAELYEKTTRALVGLGFSKTDVSRVMVAIAQRHGADTTAPPLGDLVREGIVALT